MVFTFWQNVISIHQIPFLKALSTKHNVTLCVEKSIENVRAEEGWKIPDLGDIRIYVAPNDVKTKSLLNASSIHVFSGISTYPMVYDAFKKAVAKGFRIGVLSEPYDPRGIKGILRNIKYQLLYLRYGASIDYLFVTGLLGEKCYSKTAIKSDKIKQWGYFPSGASTLKYETVNDLPAIIYIGKLDNRKNILKIVEYMVTQSHRFNRFTIIGNGPHKDAISALIANEKKIELLGNIPNDKIPSYISQHDLLLLPSLFDGWGAVINEALLCGTRVLASDMCGGSILLQHNTRGLYVPIDRYLCTLDMELNRPPLSQRQRNNIRSWAITNISPLVAAEYFSSIFKGEPALAPWLKNIK